MCTRGSLIVRLGFNRYMVECESWISEEIDRLLERFNRYMVECELLQNER